MQKKEEKEKTQYQLITIDIETIYTIDKLEL